MNINFITPNEHLSSLFEKAAANSRSSSFVDRHFKAPGFGLRAGVEGLFYAPYYLGRGGTRLVCSISQGYLKKGFDELCEDLVSSGKSLLVVAAAISLFVVGIFMPQWAYGSFVSLAKTQERALHDPSGASPPLGEGVSQIEQAGGDALPADPSRVDLPMIPHSPLHDPSGESLSSPEQIAPQIEQMGERAPPRVDLQMIPYSPPRTWGAPLAITEAVNVSLGRFPCLQPFPGSLRSNPLFIGDPRRLEIIVYPGTPEDLVRRGLHRGSEDLPEEGNLLGSSFCEVLDFKKVEKSVEIDSKELDSFHAEYVLEFCKKEGQNPYNREQVGSLIRTGEALLKIVDRGKEAEIPLIDRKSLMAGFVWMLMFRAHQTGQSFEQGMFVFDDPDHRIVRFFSEEGAGSSVRPSSHFKQRREDSWGMDIVQDYTTGLPAHHQTAHFGRLKPSAEGISLSFLKPENWGLQTWDQWVGHALDFFVTRLHNPESSGQRKEHLPEKVKSDFQKIFASVEIKIDDSIVKDLNTYGLSGMIRFLIGCIEKLDLTSDQLLSIKKFFKELDEKYDDLHAQLRTGDEAIVSLFRKEVIHLEGQEDDYRKFKICLELKTAETAAAIEKALRDLAEWNSEGNWIQVPHLIQENIDSYENREALLKQLGQDLPRVNGASELFLVKGRAFWSPDLLLEEVKKYAKDEAHAFKLLTFMTQSVKSDYIRYVTHLMKNPIAGLTVIHQPTPSEPTKTNITLDETKMVIDIKTRNVLQASDLTHPIFQQEPYAIIWGDTHIILPMDAKRMDQDSLAKIRLVVESNANRKK